MTTMKTLAIVALLLGGTSLAMAQSGPPTGGQPPAGQAPAATPSPPPPGVIPHDAPRPQATAPSPNMQSAAPPAGTTAGTATRHHMAKGSVLSTKGSALSAKGSVLSAKGSASNKNMYMSAKGGTHKSKKTSTKGGY